MIKEYETSKGFKVKKFDTTLSVTDQLIKRGFYRFLTYDTTQGMNIGCSDESEIDSLFQALKYYQKRLLTVEQQLNTLEKEVDRFVNAVRPTEEESTYDV